MALPAIRPSSGTYLLYGKILSIQTANDRCYFVAPEDSFIQLLCTTKDATTGPGDDPVLTITTALGALTRTYTYLNTNGGETQTQTFSKEDTNNFIAAGEGFKLVSDGDGTSGDLSEIIMVMGML